MSEDIAGGPRISPWRILLALVGGLVVGAMAARIAPDRVIGVADAVAPIGQLWLRALQMTIIPLVVALLFTGILSAVRAARAGRLTGWSIGLFLIILWGGATMAAFVTPALLNAFPISAEAARTLTASLGTNSNVGTVPTMSDFLIGIIPTNPVQAAATDAILPLLIFTAIFALAVARLDPQRRDLIAQIFDAVGSAMLTVIGWVLALAPIGVAALAFVVAAHVGVEAIGIFLHYVLVVSAVGGVVFLAAYPVAMLVGGLPLGQFAKAILPPQAVALSTQSSLASLPAMLRSASMLGVRAHNADVTLPLAVALFRATGPAMNLAVCIYAAYLTHTPVTPVTLAIGVAIAATTTLGSVSLPGSISFISACGPIAIGMGVPIEPLALLIAVEQLPDLMRTLGNVTMDVAVTASADRLGGGDLVEGEG